MPSRACAVFRIARIFVPLDLLAVEISAAAFLFVFRPLLRCAASPELNPVRGGLVFAFLFRGALLFRSSGFLE
ncbi:MAG: hypothetical protein RIE84_04150 [Parvibaculum sp.]